MNTHSNKKVEEILNSLDGSKRAAMPDFFYTRLKARMEKGPEPDFIKSWVPRPAYAIAALVAVLLINAAVMLKGDTAREDVSVTSDTETIQSLAAEYSLNDNSSVYELTQDK